MEICLNSMRFIYAGKQIPHDSLQLISALGISKESTFHQVLSFPGVFGYANALLEDEKKLDAIEASNHIDKRTLAEISSIIDNIHSLKVKSFPNPVIFERSFQDLEIRLAPYIDRSASLVLESTFSCMPPSSNTAVHSYQLFSSSSRDKSNAEIPANTGLMHSNSNGCLGAGKLGPQEIDHSLEAQLPPYYRVNNAFERAIIACKENPATDGEHKKVFITQLKKLQQETLKKLVATDIKYTFNTANCLLLAAQALQLATKVGNVSIEESDCQYFVNNTKAFKNNKIIATILSAIIGAVTGMVIGAVCGYMVAGIIGGAIGLGIGFFSGGVGAASLARIYQQKTDHRMQLVNSAQKIVQHPRLMA
jgi:hypothetical protein